jgi:hypothetical protein
MTSRTVPGERADDAAGRRGRDALAVRSDDHVRGLEPGRRHAPVDLLTRAPVGLRPPGTRPHAARRAATCCDRVISRASACRRCRRTCPAARPQTGTSCAPSWIPPEPSSSRLPDEDVDGRIPPPSFGSRRTLHRHDRRDGVRLVGQEDVRVRGEQPDEHGRDDEDHDPRGGEWPRRLQIARG